MGKKKKRRSKGKELYRLIMAYRSIHHAAITCTFITDNNITENDALYYSFMTSICVLYARPFMGSNNVGSLPKKFSQFSRPDLEETHAEVIRARNQLYAHVDAGIGNAHSGNVPPNRVSVRVDHVQTSIGLEVSYQAIFSEAFLRPVKVPLITELCHELTEKLEEETNRLWSEFFQGQVLSPGTYPIDLASGG